MNENVTLSSLVCIYGHCGNAVVFWLRHCPIKTIWWPQTWITLICHFFMATFSSLIQEYPISNSVINVVRTFIFPGKCFGQVVCFAFCLWKLILSIQASNTASFPTLPFLQRFQKPRMLGVHSILSKVSRFVVIVLLFFETIYFPCKILIL